MDTPARNLHVYTDHCLSGFCPKFVLFDSFKGVKCPDRKICFASLRKQSCGDIPLQFPNLTAFTPDLEGISFRSALCPFGAPPKDTFSHGRPDRLWCPPRKAICPAVHFPQISAINAMSRVLRRGFEATATKVYSLPPLFPGNVSRYLRHCPTPDKRGPQGRPAAFHNLQMSAR